jgi:hypothetical protein
MTMAIRELTAYHEAGHAVAALRLGLAFDKVTVRPDTGTHGELLGVRFQPHQDDERAQVKLAGLVAERIRAGSWKRVDLVGATSDVSTACHIIASRGGDLEGCLRWHASEAGKLIANKWGAVESIANALLSVETLAERDARRLAASAVAEMSTWHRASSAKLARFAMFWGITSGPPCL